MDNGECSREKNISSVGDIEPGTLTSSSLDRRSLVLITMKPVFRCHPWDPH